MAVERRVPRQDAPDKGNYGQGDVFGGGLALERAQIEQGREAASRAAPSSATSATGQF